MPQAQRIAPPAYPDIVRSDEDRDRFDRLYDDLVRVLGLSPAEALLNAATQFELGFDVRGPFDKRKRRKKVVMQTAQDRREEGAELPFDLEPPG
ncbi:MAG TPA: hypothetical protein VKR80_01750 [Candidatus Limnocylindria bacterium]|nr:hypothetical protein [Candidatus Limnocylindria bacterium]